MAAHDFDQRGFCRHCGIGKGRFDRTQSPCPGVGRGKAWGPPPGAKDTAQRSPSMHPTAQVERRRRTDDAVAKRRWRSRIPLRRKLTIVALMNSAALVMPVAGLLVFWLSATGTESLEERREGLVCPLPAGCDPEGALLYVAFFAIGVAAVLLTVFVPWTSAGAFTLLGRFIGIVPAVLGIAALWWLVSEYGLRATLTGGAPFGWATTIGAVSLCLWAASGLLSVFLDLLELLFGIERFPFAVEVGLMLWEDFEGFWRK